MRPSHWPTSLLHISFCWSSATRMSLDFLRHTPRGESFLADTARGLRGSQAGRWSPLLVLAWCTFAYKGMTKLGPFQSLQPHAVKTVQVDMQGSVDTLGRVCLWMVLSLCVCMCRGHRSTSCILRHCSPLYASRQDLLLSPHLTNWLH